MAAVFSSFNPKTPAIVWTVVYALSLLLGVGSILHLISVRIVLFERHVWVFVPEVRLVWYGYLRRDLFRFARLTLYLLVGIGANFLPNPVRESVRDFDTLVAAVLIVGALMEMIEGAFELHYRLRWFSPPA